MFMQLSLCQALGGEERARAAQDQALWKLTTAVNLMESLHFCEGVTVMALNGWWCKSVLLSEAPAHLTGALWKYFNTEVIVNRGVKFTGHMRARLYTNPLCLSQSYIYLMPEKCCVNHLNNIQRYSFSLLLKPILFTLEKSLKSMTRALNLLLH